MGVLSPSLATILWSDALSPPQHEVARITAPDKNHDAVVVQVQASLLSPEPSWQVCMVTRQTPAARGKVVFSATGVSDLTVTWPESRLVQIVFDRARVNYFTNASSWSDGDAIEVRMAPTNKDFSYLFASAKAGGLAQPPK